MPHFGKFSIFAIALAAVATVAYAAKGMENDALAITQETRPTTANKIDFKPAWSGHSARLI